MAHEVLLDLAALALQPGSSFPSPGYLATATLATFLLRKHGRKSPASEPLLLLPCLLLREAFPGHLVWKSAPVLLCTHAARLYFSVCHPSLRLMR